MCCIYLAESMPPYSFSHTKVGPLIPPAKLPQNIQPLGLLFRSAQSSMASGSSSLNSMPRFFHMGSLTAQVSSENKTDSQSSGLGRRASCRRHHANRSSFWRCVSRIRLGRMTDLPPSSRRALVRAASLYELRGVGR